MLSLVPISPTNMSEPLHEVERLSFECKWRLPFSGMCHMTRNRFTECFMTECRLVKCRLTEYQTQSAKTDRQRWIISEQWIYSSYFITKHYHSIQVNLGTYKCNKWLRITLKRDIFFVHYRLFIFSAFLVNLLNEDPLQGIDLISSNSSYLKLKSSSRQIPTISLRAVKKCN